MKTKPPAYPNETTEAFRKRAAKTARLKKNPFRGTLKITAPRNTKTYAV